MQASSNQGVCNHGNATPTCKKQVHSFIGMINYLSKFSVILSELVEPIRELSKEKIPLNWGLEHQEAFTMMKREIAKPPVLAYNSLKKQTILQIDTSIKGLGACFLQDERPVYFVSKASTEAPKGYVAIELESLTVEWAMEKFHHFLYASQFTANLCLLYIVMSLAHLVLMNIK